MAVTASAACPEEALPRRRGPASGAGVQY